MVNVTSQRNQDYTKRAKTSSRVNGKVLFKGDIYPGKQIKGYVELDGTKRTIYRSRKPRNQMALFTLQNWS